MTFIVISALIFVIASLPYCISDACAFAKKMGKDDFVATEGWFRQWQK
jgi:hypothetical protein